MAKAPASKKSPSRRPWAKEDVKLLKSMARKETAADIAKALKRTEGATRQKATALGVSLDSSKARATAKKSASKAPAAKAPAPKTAAKKTAAKKTVAKKAPAKKVPAKKRAAKKD